MRLWPHSPAHKDDLVGVYMITAATYLKTPFFASRERLDLLQGWIFDLSLRYGAALQAWAIFPNHYHFIAALKEPTSLSRFIGHIHTKTAMDVNRLDGMMGRRVWFQFWDSHLTHRGSYFARLHYVHENAVRHGVVRLASNYPWCSAGWLERKATTAFRKTILKCRCESVSVQDNFDVKMDFLDGA